MTWTPRVTVVRDHRAPRMYVNAPDAAGDLVRALPRAKYDHVIRRWLVPADQEDALLAALAKWSVSVTDDHRMTRRQVPARARAAKAAPLTAPTPVQEALL